MGAMLATSMLFFSSCLKNNQYYVDLSKYNPSIEIPLAANGPAIYPLALAVVDTPTHFPVYVNVASVNALNQPVTATLGLDTAYLNQYNAEHAAADSTYVPFELLPDSVWSVSDWNVTVPAGQHLAFDNITLNTSKLDATHNYILPITIVKSSIALNSWIHFMLHVTAISPWAGKYGIHVTISGNNAYSGTDFTDNVSLSTVSGNTVSEGDIADFFGGYTGYTFNPDGTISVNASSSSAGNNTYGAVVNSSTYDATTHNFHVNYSILGGKYVFDLTYTRQ